DLPRAWDEGAAGFLTAVAAKVALALENGRLYASLKEYYLSALQALAAALEARDAYTRGHSVRVAKLSRACARALGLSGDEQEQVYLAALLHDIGKIGVPESVLHRDSLRSCGFSGRGVAGKRFADRLTCGGGGLLYRGTHPRRSGRVA
ncbi:MAG TPA: hypothetical protein DCL13_07115, partial [Peptococcaceae bacterium]|nr:hypothetical protein [Peptococcaceae bacterium]